MKNIFIRTFLIILVLFSFNIKAEEYPSKPIKILVPFQIGSVTDIIARLVANSLSFKLKQAVIIENKTGAGGIIAGVTLLNSSPDGYTLGLLVAGNSIQTWVVKDMPFDIRKDFLPITEIYSGYSVLLVSDNFPSRTLNDFINYTKEHPGKTFFGSSGTATTTHLAGELLKDYSKIEITHVPFKGSSEVVNAILNGSIQTYFDLYGTSKSLIQSGKVRPIAVTSPKRMPELPNVPSLAETYPGFEIAARVGLAAPKGTSKEILSILVSETRNILQSPDVRKTILALGVEPGGTSPDEYLKSIISDTEKWGKAVKVADIKIE